MIISYIIRVLRVARNGGQALVTPLDRFLCRVRLYRGVTMLRPRLHAIPERVVDFFAFLLKICDRQARECAGNSISLFTPPRRKTAGED